MPVWRYVHECTYICSYVHGHIHTYLVDGVCTVTESVYDRYIWNVCYKHRIYLYNINITLLLVRECKRYLNKINRKQNDFRLKLEREGKILLLTLLTCAHWKQHQQLG